MMDAFIQDLKKSLACEVRSDRATQAVYAVDASIFEIEPVAVCLPRTADDMVAAIKIAAKHSVPIIPRGAGTGISGGCIGKGLVIDTSKYLRRIISIDPINKRAVVEPGVIQDEFNSACLPFDLRLGPDTSTGNRATIGGMVANNAAGAHSLVYGRMCDHVEELDLILYTGDVIRTKNLTDAEWQEKCLLHTMEGHIYRELDDIRKISSAAIKTDFPTLERRSSGYNLDELLKSNNLSKLIVGSQGTLGCISKITIRISEKLPQASLVLIAVQDMITALRQLPKCRPLALEMIDRHIIDAGRESPHLRGKLSFLPQTCDALFMYEFASNDTVAIQACVDAHKQHANTISCTLIDDAAVQQHVWNLRKAGLGLLLSKRSYSRAIAFIEDVAVPHEALAPFTEQLIQLLHSHERDAGIYGHIGDGCLHVRPYINLLVAHDMRAMESILHGVAALVKRFHGVLSAEHGDGLIRSYLNRSMFGDAVYEIFCRIKKAFDPLHIMNPEKIVTDSTHREHLRLSPITSIQPQETFLDFSFAGGFELAADLCNGNGSCRKKEGVMCPSYQATLDEKDSTRARAQVLRSLIHGKISRDDLTTKPFYEVFDLCIQCKGCKTECPSEVDMAKMKTEYVYWYHSKHGYPLRSYLFGHIGSLFRAASIAPRLSNALMSLIRPLLPCFGITNKRALPKLSPKRFSEMNHDIQPGSPIVLFNDTFTEYTHASLGMHAKHLMEAAGYSVLVPPWICCGRTMFSKGLLPQAKKQALKLLNVLYPLASDGLFITILEPSCLSMLKDDWYSLRLDLSKVDTVVSMCRSLEEVLLPRADILKSKLHKQLQPIYIHTHCHEKAASNLRPALQLLRLLFPGKIEEIPSGCCGMAGSFGYESEHYDISMKIANHTLMPFIDRMEPESIIVMNGTSCREQTASEKHPKPIHLATLLHQLLL